MLQNIMLVLYTYITACPTTPARGKSPIVHGNANFANSPFRRGSTEHFSPLSLIASAYASESTLTLLNCQKRIKHSHWRSVPR